MNDIIKSILDILTLAAIPIVITYMNKRFDKQYFDHDIAIKKLQEHIDQELHDSELIKSIEDIKNWGVQITFKDDKYGLALAYINTVFAELGENLITSIPINAANLNITLGLLNHAKNDILRQVKPYFSTPQEYKVFEIMFENIQFNKLIGNIKNIYIDLYNSKKKRLTNEIRLFLCEIHDFFEKEYAPKEDDN